MTLEQLNNVNVVSQELLPTPERIKQQLPLTDKAMTTVLKGRDTVQRILDREDHRLFIVVGPCSIHDLDAAREYAARLKQLADDVKDTLVLVMRVYFEKPRTTVGWKGLINDPYLDDSFHIEKGLYLARQFLLEVAELGLPAATEALDPIVPQYISDLVTWTAIGARTTESQTHREMSSGLSTPVGFKNGTDGSLMVAINALRSAAYAHHFLGINSQGQCARFRTRGNRYGHVVLRGGNKPNYDAVSVALAEAELTNAGMPVNIMIDCSHGNCMKDPELEPLVLKNCIDQIVDGNRSIIGMMVESHLEWGSQPLPADLAQLRYGVSITDPCIDWRTTDAIVREARDRIRDILPRRTR
ncbi:MAG: 3-deoxy-7-phosphoheptulonate synthase [Gammaproteobacteria bacterium]|nr:MAG: 3-deoxy-7-phosphoheptulonate synthase [Gammaproteobacteria bacterium]TND06797.1 MAG: 3-deoxy-7-phosphoheptulonate synthase [Gammaproteobacteria bacterium]